MNATSACGVGERGIADGYAPAMAKVMVSIPDDLLSVIDAEVNRRGTTRSALLQAAARREIDGGGLMSEASRVQILARLDAIGAHWKGPFDAGTMIREDRHRDDGPTRAQLAD